MTPLPVPRVVNSLYFRASALFLALLGIVLGGYFLWIEATVSSPYDTDAEEDWYAQTAEVELDALAARLPAALTDDDAAAAQLREFGARAAPFDTEILLFDADGKVMLAAAGDSLAAAVPQVDAALLTAMALPDWDFSSYPIADDVDLYENRIFQVNRLAAADTTQPPLGFLVASFQPLVLGAAELETDTALMDRQTLLVKVLVGMLIWSAISALLIMAWTSRRVQLLSDGVAAFAGGDLQRRVNAASSDEIGRLGRHFNHMAESLEGMVESLQQKELFQRQLIANVSHDLRTPMASARGHAETLGLRFAQLDEGQRQRFLDTIVSNLDHLERLIERTLVLSRFDTDQAVFQPESFSLIELVDAVLERCAPLADAAGVTATLQAPTDLPAVEADPLQISQVLQNLIENAIKFNRPGGVVTVVAQPDGDGVAVAVRDSGQGIPEVDLPHIFERFYTGSRSRSRSRTAATGDGPSPQGSGLGLAIAAKIVAKHGGLLTAKSRPGAGAEFSFRLPTARLEDREQSNLG